MARCKLTLGSLLLAGCATAPISFISTTPRAPDDAYTCSLRKLNELGYTVTNTSREAGFVTGTKQTSGLGTKLFTGSEYHDQLTISIFDEGSGARKIRATAGRVDRKSNVFGTQVSSIKPSDKGMSDASAVLVACGSGDVVKQGEASYEGEAQ